jgi:5-oxoprolinase (ATP-hydrolysing) subunit A
MGAGARVSMPPESGRQGGARSCGRGPRPGHGGYDAGVRIDLNVDCGESLDESDAAILPLVTSANVACGGHAGDLATMARTVALAVRHGLAVGAHPGYPDREGFGRRPMALTAADLEEEIVRQVAALAEVARAEGAVLRHVKPHGALYDLAARDAGVRGSVLRAVRRAGEGIVLFGLAGSLLLDAGRELGLPVAAEGFADRAYEPDGGLRPRSQPGAVHEDVSLIAEQAVTIARDGRAPLAAGGWVTVEAETLCLHGDHPGAIANARAVREALTLAGVAISPLPACS